MAEITVTNRRELVEAARALYRQINDVAVVAAILHAARHEVEYPDRQRFGVIVGADGVRKYAIKAMQDQLDGIYDRMDKLFDAAGIGGMLFSDEAMGLAPGIDAAIEHNDDSQAIRVA